MSLLLFSYLFLLISYQSVSAKANSLDSFYPNVKTVYMPLLSMGSYLPLDYHKPLYLYEETEIDGECLHRKDSMGKISVNYMYLSTYDTKSIAKELLNGSEMTFQGCYIKSFERAEETFISNKESILADYFGMSPTTNATICIDPQIIQSLINLEYSISGNNFWIQVNLPFKRETWKLLKNNHYLTDISLNDTYLQIGEIVSMKEENIKDFSLLQEDLTNASSFSEELENTSNKVFNAGYITSLQDYSKNNFNLLDSYAGNKNSILNQLVIKPSLTGLNLVDALGDSTFGDLKEKKYNIFDPMKNTASGLADIHIKIGYDILNRDSSHLGFYTKIVIPTGTEIDKNHMTYLFQPFFGNGKHYELGGGISAHYQFLNRKDSSYEVHFDAYGTHLFSRRTFRSFDLENKPLTRYALLKTLEYDFDNFIDGTGGDNLKTLDTPIYQYNGTLKRAGDVNAKYIDTEIDIQGEALINFLYTKCNWQGSIGYSFAGKTEEKYKECKNATSTDELYYGLKGISGLNRIEMTTENTKIKELNIKTNNDIDPNSTMYNYSVDINNINQQKKSYSADTNISSLLILPKPNMSGFSNAQILHRVFGQFNYAWTEVHMMPTVSIFGSVSFDQACYRTAKSWSLGGKIECSF